MRFTAVGSIFRRIVSIIACLPAVRSLCSALSPIQLGVGIRAGFEAAVHDTNFFLRNPVILSVPW